MYTVPSGVTLVFNGGSVEGEVALEDGAAVIMADNASLDNPEDSEDVSEVVVSAGKTLKINGETELDLIVNGTLIPSNCSVDNLILGTEVVSSENVKGVVKWEDSSSFLSIKESLTATNTDGSSIDLSATNFDVSEAMGHLGVPANTDVSTFTKDNLVVILRGADIQTLEAHRTGDATLTINVTFGSNHYTSYAYAVEKQVSGEWVLVDGNVTSASKSLTTTIPSGQTWIRAFDGDSFIYDYIWTVLGTFMDVTSMCIENDEDISYFVLSKIVTPTAVARAKQTVTVLARVCTSSDSTDALLNDWEGNITSVVYTCYKISSNSSGTVRTAVTGHNSVSVTTDCVSDSVATSKLWTGSNFGYNFSLTPNTRTNELFPEAGTYEIEITIAWKDEEGTTQTPITFSKKVEVLV